jgi:trigger factor
VLTTSVERLEGNNIKLSVTISADEVDQAVEKAYKNVGEKIKIPGFRPGKAPRPMLDTMVGRDYILQEATEEIVEGTYPRALDNEDLRPIESPEMEELPMVEPGKDYTYEAGILLRPEFELAPVDAFAVTVRPAEATQAEVDAQIDVARGRYATLEPVEDRGVEEGDFVLLSFVGAVSGEAYDGNVVDKYLYEMGQGLLPAEFDAGLIGAMPGEERRIEFEIPETTSVEDYVGKNAEFDVTIHEIKSRKLPDVDDEFAMNVGGFDSVDELRSQLTEAMNRQAEVGHFQEKERKLRETLAEKLDGEAPEQMVNARADSMLRDFMAMLETREMTLDQYFAGTGMGMPELEAQMKEQGRQAVLEDLALEALFRQKGFEITQEDIDTELEGISASIESTPEETRKRWEDMGLMGVIREQIMHRKAVEWLMENSTVTIEEPGAASQEAGFEESQPKKKAAAKKAAAKKPAAKKPAAKKKAAPKDEPDASAG